MFSGENRQRFLVMLKKNGIWIHAESKFLITMSCNISISRYHSPFLDNNGVNEIMK